MIGSSNLDVYYRQECLTELYHEAEAYRLVREAEGKGKPRSGLYVHFVSAVAHLMVKWGTSLENKFSTPDVFSPAAAHAGPNTDCLH